MRVQSTSTGRGGSKRRTVDSSTHRSNGNTCSTLPIECVIGTEAREGGKPERVPVPEWRGHESPLPYDTSAKTDRAWEPFAAASPLQDRS